jgi:hypothetical protein
MAAALEAKVAEEGRRCFAEVKAKVRNAWIVFARLPDSDARFRQGLRGGWIFPVVRDPGESYGWQPPWLKAVSTPKEISEMETVMEWMAWLRRFEGDVALRRVMGWAAGMPMLVLASREQCSARTIANRINRSLAKIMLEFLSVVAVIDPMGDDKPKKRRQRITSFTQPPARSSGSGPSTADAPDFLEPGKVYVGGDFISVARHMIPRKGLERCERMVGTYYRRVARRSFMHEPLDSHGSLLERGFPDRRCREQ